MLDLVTMFIAGLMVGRTPEYLGKKIEAREVKLVVPLAAPGRSLRKLPLGSGLTCFRYASLPSFRSWLLRHPAISPRENSG